MNSLRAWFSLFFNWPAGGVWSNVVAEVITVPLTAVITAVWVRRATIKHFNVHFERHHQKMIKHLDAAFDQRLSSDVPSQSLGPAPVSDSIGGDGGVESGPAG